MKERLLRIHEVNEGSTTEEIIAALREVHNRILRDHSILRTRTFDRPREDDSNQNIWVAAIEIYDDTDNQNGGFVRLVQRLNTLAQAGILCTRTRQGKPPRFRLAI
ncbi:MAG: hypothetical protein KIH67_002420 [Candidatus Moranbacteria bacterium]|nr:hypothetical protein [Candidatus Moranbacteria bacterium]